MNSKIIAFAIDAHNKTNHLYDGKPYSVHLSMVAMYGMKYINCIPEQCQETVINACWLHDTIEDCRLTYNDVKKIAGEDVANIVYAVTNEKGKTRKERANDLYYYAIRETRGARFVKLCDRLANVRYSFETKSKMFEVYKNENEHFINSLFPLKEEQTNKIHYTDLINELCQLLNVVAA
jgi:(p)ppGpp synthase/HD superfamily hydrolase